MPRTGGVYSAPAGTKGSPNTTIQSAKYNAMVDDLVLDANGARPITAGGTNATSASGARTALGLEIGTNVQAYDVDLAAIAALTTAADKLPYATGAGTWALTTFTAFGRSLVDDADAATARATLGLGSIATQAANSVGITGGTISGITDLAVADGGTGASTAAAARTNLGLGSLATQSLVDNADWDSAGADLAVANGGTGASDAATARANLGLAIGTNIQAYDIVLQTFSGLTPATDRIPYFTGASTSALATFTAAGRALLDDADAASQRTTLGLTPFVSAQQAITIGGSATVAHGLGARPSYVMVELVCTTADLGYSVGDVVQYGTHTLNISGIGHIGGVGIEMNATNVILRYPSNGMSVWDKTQNSGAWQYITPGRWRIVVRAYR